MSRFLAWAHKYLVYFVIGICLAGGWYGMRAKQTMHTRAHYTIGYINGGVYRPQSGKSYSYYYRVGGKKYEATDISETGMETRKGARFLVEFDSVDPEVSTGHFTVSIPDSIIASPLHGWTNPFSR